MVEKSLRFEAGYPVVVELIDAKDESKCRFGYKVGDSWVVSVWECDGLCGLAYNAFFPFISMFQTGGQAVWKGAEGDKSNVVRTCPDSRAGFRFLIRRKEG